MHKTSVFQNLKKYKMLKNPMKNSKNMSNDKYFCLFFCPKLISVNAPFWKNFLRSNNTITA